MIRLKTLSLAVGVLLLAAVPALAVVHPRLVAPKNGRHVRARHAPTFVVHDATKKQSFNHIYLLLSSSRKLDKCGLLKNTSNGEFHVMHRKKGTKATYVYKPHFYDYPKFWLERPGKYYWQVHRIGDGGSATRSPRRSAACASSASRSR